MGQAQLIPFQNVSTFWHRRSCSRRLLLLLPIRPKSSPFCTLFARGCHSFDLFWKRPLACSGGLVKNPPWLDEIQFSCHLRTMDKQNDWGGHWREGTVRVVKEICKEISSTIQKAKKPLISLVLWKLFWMKHFCFRLFISFKADA